MRGAAAALVRTGRRLKIDVGLADNGQEKRIFLEACSVGLLSALDLDRRPRLVSRLRPARG